MSLNWKGKSALPGLMERIAQAGIAVGIHDGAWYCSDEAGAQALIDAYTVADAIKWRQAECLVIAKGLRDRVVGHISPGEMASWPIKRAEALAYAQSGDPAQAPMLSAEAAARGVTLPALLAKVQANSSSFAALEAAIGGADGKHRDALAQLQTIEAVLAYDLTAGWPAV